MKVLLCSSEVVPYAKTGGLADVAGSLPIYLKKAKVDIRVCMPKYSSIKIKASKTKMGKDIPVYFIKNDKYFDRPYLYGTAAGDYPDNLERFSYFCKATLELLKKEGFRPDVIHCNDWQTALIPVYLKTRYKDDPFYSGIKTVFTIHNMAYQGIFAKEQYPTIGIGWEHFNIEGLEFYGMINLMKGALIFSDFITTVSPTYSAEIQTSEFGCKLEGVLAKRRDSLTGILNGIDYQEWNPQKDKELFRRYSPGLAADKVYNKVGLQKECGLPVKPDMPLLGAVGRLAHQKGFDILAEKIGQICSMDLQFVLLGTGDEVYHEVMQDIAKKYPKKTSINIRFDAILAKRIYAGSDFFLMPSRYEPCGLGQLIALRYGTIPIVRKTGGLADTIFEFDPATKEGNGFVFEEYSSQELLNAVKRALEVYKNRKLWLGLVKKAMEYDFSWDSSADKYVKLYKKILG
jgi:starch synthase